MAAWMLPAGRARAVKGGDTEGWGGVHHGMGWDGIREEGGRREGRVGQGRKGRAVFIVAPALPVE